MHIAMGRNHISAERPNRKKELNYLYKHRRSHKGAAKATVSRQLNLNLYLFIWLVLGAFTHEGMARHLGGWLVTYQDKCPAPGIEPEHGHPSTPAELK